MVPLRKKPEGLKHHQQNKRHPSKKRPCRQCGHESVAETTDYGGGASHSEMSNGPYHDQHDSQIKIKKVRANLIVNEIEQVSGFATAETPAE